MRKAAPVQNKAANVSWPFLEYLIVIVFSIFIIFAPFTSKIVKPCFFVMTIAWIISRILNFRGNFFQHLIPVNFLSTSLSFFFIACTLSVVFSINPIRSQGIFFDRYLTYLLFFIIAVDIFKVPRYLYLFIFIFVGWNFLFGIGALWDYFYYSIIVPNVAYTERIWSIFGKRIMYYGFPLYVTMYAPFNFFVFIFAKNKILKWLCGINFIMLITCLFLNSTRIGWAAVIGSIILIFFSREKKYLGWTIVILMCLIAVSFILPNTRSRLQTISKPSEWSNRMPLYRSAIAMYKDRPVFGSGIGMFEKILHTPRYELPQNYPVPKELNLHAHNTYLETASEMGTIGLLTFLAIFFCFFRRFIGWFRSKPTHTNPDEQAFTFGLSASILASLIFAFGTSIIIVGLNVSAYFWFLFGIAAGLLQKHYPAKLNA